ncbi:hypothetical protein TanjilG_11733 [Lupinus angustifolius]|uniref:Uncharacterized protein n=1 Tax=Lupinus angustifolius TaxID=3871 RepID=A0A1J7GR02_LUPAN|nr:PREDICTED: uncharacterized protein LOC109327882 [Lupinus angustifolius]OIV96737.1 hypothetical protein TanjilG_11733 [Lupinus angustifolius]
MGCWFSTPNTEKGINDLKNKQPQFRSYAPKPNTTHEVHNKTTLALLPQHLEEETVKEVLSETPISKPHQVPILMAKTNTQMLKTEKGEVPIMNNECNISESFSTTTATTVSTVTENREDEATSKRRTTVIQKRKKRSYAVDDNRTGERERRQKSPARMPAKRVPVSSPAVCRRESGQLRRDPGEDSRRRPRSPSSSGKVSGGVNQSQMKPPGRGGQRLPPAKFVENERVGEENDVVPKEESFEHSHVSLECFIFL